MRKVTNEATKGRSGLGPPPRRPSEQEIGARRELVYKLICSGSTVDQVVIFGKRQGYGESALRRDHEAIVRSWRASLDGQCETARAEAIQRIRRDLSELRNPGQLRNRNGYPVFETVRDPRSGAPIKRDGRAVKRPVMASVNSMMVARFEELLMKLEGSATPTEVRVDVDVRERRAALAIVARLTPELEERLICENVGAEVIAKLLDESPHHAPAEDHDEDRDADDDEG